MRKGCIGNMVRPKLKYSKVLEANKVDNAGTRGFDTVEHKVLDFRDSCDVDKVIVVFVILRKLDLFDVVRFSMM